MSDLKKDFLEKVKELKDFHDKNPKVFEELSDGVKLLLDSIKTQDADTVASGVNYVAELNRAERLLDEEIQLKKTGANAMQAVVHLAVKILTGQVT
jgi:hypothetical protein